MNPPEAIERKAIMADDIESTRKVIEKIASDFQAKVAAELIAQDSDSEPVYAESAATVKQTADRLLWILRAAQAHSQGDMPWRAKPPTKEDEAWCEQLIEAVLAKRARPPHPDPDIEQVLLDALPT